MCSFPCHVCVCMFLVAEYPVVARSSVPPFNASQMTQLPTYLHTNRQGRPSVAGAGVPSHAAAADTGEKEGICVWLGCGVVWLLRVGMPVYVVGLSTLLRRLTGFAKHSYTNIHPFKTQVCLLDDYLYIAAAGSNQVPT